MLDVQSIADSIDRALQDIPNTGLLPFAERMQDLSTTIRMYRLLEDEDD